jgi:redox-sensing transcriptional repressor
MSLYLRQLESAQTRGLQTLSSGQLAASLGLNDAQVRKDLAFFGHFGRPGIGYQISDLIPALRGILGIDRDWPAALVGLGNLGRALVQYRGFRSRGFHIVALFDTDPKIVGRRIDGLTVLALDTFAVKAAELGLVLAVLCVPAEAAQGVADLAVSCGVRGLLNFAPAPLAVPPGVSLLNVDLSLQLEQLAYQVQSLGRGINQPA